MESDNDQPSEQLAQAESLPKVIYRAVVWVAGTYKPSQSRMPDGGQSNLIGFTIAAYLTLGGFTAAIRRTFLLVYCK